MNHLRSGGILLGTLAMLLLPMPTARAQALEREWHPPRIATFYSMYQGGTNARPHMMFPPVFNPALVPVYVLDRTNSIFLMDDTAVGGLYYSSRPGTGPDPDVQASDPAGGRTGPGRWDCGTNLCLEIEWSTNCPDQVALILHNTTYGWWEIQNKTNLADSNEPWTFVDLEFNDGTTPDLFCGIYSAKDPPIRFFRGVPGPTNLVEIVTNNLPNPVGVDYHPTNYSLILPINYIDNNPAFGILDTNLFLTSWSGLGPINAGYEVRLTTVKAYHQRLNCRGHPVRQWRSRRHWLALRRRYSIQSELGGAAW